MELKTAIEILDYHQEWRLGKRDDMIHEPKKLTEALDLVISQVKKDLIAGVGKRFWLTDKMEVVLLCERCDAPTTKVMIEHQKVVSEKEVECDCGEDIYDDDGY